MEANDSQSLVTRKRWGLIAVGVTGAVAVGLSVVSAPFVSPALRRFCLPYVPATNKQVNNVMKMCKKYRITNGSAERLVDLGSGDGRIVFEAARNGFLSTGIELNLWLVLYSKVAGSFKGLRGKAQFQRKDLWTVDLSIYDKIVIFGVSEMMSTLKEKLEKEMNNDCKVIACRFPIPNWIPIDIIDDGIDTVWLYDLPRLSKSSSNVN